MQPCESGPFMCLRTDWSLVEKKLLISLVGISMEPSFCSIFVCVCLVLKALVANLSVNQELCETPHCCGSVGNIDPFLSQSGHEHLPEKGDD